VFINNKDYIMKIQTLTKLALTGLIFAGLYFTTGCEKSPEENAADTMEEATDAVQDAAN
jgi:hypothetical protein